MCLYSFSFEEASPARDRMGERKTCLSTEKAGVGVRFQEGDAMESVLTRVAVNSVGFEVAGPQLQLPS